MENFKKEDMSKDIVKDKLKKGIQDYAKAKFGKGSKGKRRRGRRDERRGSQITRGTQFNDISYYVKNRTITEAFAKLPFNWIVGNPLVNLHSDLRLKIPVIVSYMIDWVSNLHSTMDGGTDFLINESDDILDQVATIIYTQMRRANAGSSNGIEHVDVLISNLIASIDICVNVHYIHRMFKVANSFSWRNRMIPEYIFEHHFNLDYHDFIQNQANYRGQFDIIIAMARTIRTLADFPFINAIMDEFNNIFKDSDTDNGREQLVISVKPVHHIYDPVGTEDAPGGMVRLMTVKDVYGDRVSDYGDRIIWTGVRRVAEINNGTLKFQVFLDILQAQIRALITDADFNLIQADIEKAFGDQSGYIVVDPITDVQPLVPVYSGEFNTMFKNGRFHMPSYQSGRQDNWNYMFTSTDVGDLSHIAAQTIVNTVYQKHGNEGEPVKLGYALMWRAALEDSITNKNVELNLLNLEANDPSTDDVVIATRFKHAVNIYTGEGLVSLGIPASFVEMGAGYVVPYACSNFICWGGNVTYSQVTHSGTRVDYVDWNNTTTIIPTILLGMENPPVFINSAGELYDNVNNIRGVSNSELTPIQKSCFLSLWNLPDKTNI